MKREIAENYINILKDIENYKNWIKIEYIDKGWSKDKKFYIENNKNEKFLLRVSKIEYYDIKKKEFNMMKELLNLNINMSKPIDFGMCGNEKYVYLLLTWIEGKPLDEVIEKLSKKEQYILGIEAGKILKKFNSIQVPNEDRNRQSYMMDKINIHLNKYRECGIEIDNDDYAIQYIEKNIHILKNRIQTYQHGDYHIGNMILMSNNILGIIDFGRWGYGDPYEEFYKMMMFSREQSIPFSKGQIKGYFNDEIPNDFFRISSIYLADVILYSVVWAIPYGKEDVKGMVKRAKMILDDFDNFRNTMPSWYDEVTYD